MSKPSPNLPPPHVELDLGSTPALVIGSGEQGVRLPFMAWPAVVRAQRGSLPRPHEIERQIEIVEDWLMPLLRTHVARRSAAQTLHCDALFLSRLQPGAAAAGAVDLAQVERCFNLLADIAAGHPAAESPLPLDAAFTARLVLLREVMHHGGYATATPRIISATRTQPGEADA